MKTKNTLLLFSVLFATSTSFSQYCTAVYTNTTDDWISNVTFAGINNNSNSVGYEDFTNIIGNVTAGVTYPLSVTVSTANGSWAQYLTIFIDWNQDEVFQENTERYDIGWQTISGSYIFSDNISIPATALAGTTRMRVIEDYNNYAPAGGCVNDTYGEAEDYSLTISEPSSGVPNDIGINQFLSPKTTSGFACAGNDSVVVEVKNFGSNQIYFFDIEWSLNGIAQQTYTYTGFLDTIGGNSSNTDTINISNISLSQSIDLVAWSINPNGNVDTINANDTSSMMVDSVINLALDLGPDKVSCDGSYIVLKNNFTETFDQYQWSNGFTSPSIAVNSAGIYSLTVTEGLPNCKVSDEVEVFVASSPIIEWRSDTAFCGLGIIDAGNSGSKYSWSNGDTNQTINIASSGLYSVTVTSPEGCIDSNEIDVLINELPQVNLGSDFEICINLGEDTLIGPLLEPQLSYKWSNSATTSQIFIDTAGATPGNQTFWLEVTDINGCIESDTIDIAYKLCEPVGFTSIDNSEFLEIYPMPINGNATIDVKTNAGNIEISLFSLNGEKISNVYSGHSDGAVQINADFNDLAAGVYILQLQTDEFVSNKQIIVQK